ncbi:LAGLIDADG endonuclease [Streptomyces phage Forrest]|nr:LAGLIDADG endonuclease [Streptomyces phage Forrest]QZE11523.1 LAGLIDADG endonuclease [Streptomyces phage Jada]
MNENDLSYIAGFFDGEGCAYVSNPKASNGKRYPRVLAKIAQNDREVLDWIAELFGFGKVYGKGDGTANMNIVFASKQARKFLTAVEPYLRVKKESVTEILDLHGREPM